ncbi:hypothetical protein EC973_000302 [Apophysomyces ossiformis]|uniref:Uncharacterized protein n=1 Tax=Apophysomyces ossiformis TaxID=679940 RepID=A0A8H7BNP5_9FUNG|nr:hypothetical protein EC973_000302 [Apophysomyces ossiformis]
MSRITLTETVKEATVDDLQVTHATSTELTGTNLSSGVTTLSAGLLLLVEGAVAATTAEGMRFGVTLTEG